MTKYMLNSPILKKSKLIRYCSVDGGLDYLRRCFKNFQEEDYTELSETIETETT